MDAKFAFAKRRTDPNSPLLSVIIDSSKSTLMLAKRAIAAWNSNAVVQIREDVQGALELLAKVVIDGFFMAYSPVIEDFATRLRSMKSEAPIVIMVNKHLSTETVTFFLQSGITHLFVKLVTLDLYVPESEPASNTSSAPRPNQTEPVSRVSISLHTTPVMSLSRTPRDHVAHSSLGRKGKELMKKDLDSRKSLNILDRTEKIK
jgi:chemotaxis response regulator CheB